MRCTYSADRHGFPLTRKTRHANAGRLAEVSHSSYFAKHSALGQSSASRILRRIQSRDNGGALVETALVLPIIMVLLTGIFSVSIALYQKLQLSEATGAGGRTMALERGQNDPCTDAANAIFGAAPGLARSSLNLSITLGPQSGGTITSGTAQSYSSGSNGTAPTCTAAGLNGGSTALQPGWAAKITATYPCSLTVYGMNLGSCQIASNVTEVIQ
jgi:Flp pilus assembly protein TadG